nr:hypothetical protein [Haloferax larsenii]
MRSSITTELLLLIAIIALYEIGTDLHSTPDQTALWLCVISAGVVTSDPIATHIRSD